jgi:hypothetical protein
VTAAPPAPATLVKGNKAKFTRKGCTSIRSRQLASPVPVVSPATGIHIARLPRGRLVIFHEPAHIGAGLHDGRAAWVDIHSQGNA